MIKRLNGSLRSFSFYQLYKSKVYPFHSFVIKVKLFKDVDLH